MAMRWIIIGVLVVIVQLLIAQFGPSLVRGETIRPASPNLESSSTGSTFSRTALGLLRMQLS